MKEREHVVAGRGSYQESLVFMPQRYLLINRVPDSYVPTWFETDMYFVAYHNFVKLVLGMKFWPDQSMYSTVLPPKPRKMPGRPRKKRIRSTGEGGSSTRVSKVGLQAIFSNCKKPGHNKASCKEPILEQTPKPKGVLGRHRKNQLNVNIEDADVVLRGPLMDEGAGGSIRGAGGSRGGAGWSRKGVGRSRGGASRSRGGVGRSRGVASGSRGGTSKSRGGASGSKRKVVSSAGTQKRQGKKKKGTSGFAKWQALGAVRLSLAKNVAYNVVNEKTLYSLFKSLSNMYEKPSASNKVFLIRQLVNTKMKEGASVADHVNEFNSILSRGRKQDRGQKQNRSRSKSKKRGQSMIRQDIMCWNCNQKGHFQNQCSKPVTSRDKEVNMAAGDYDDALVCCVENMIDDRIMDSDASFVIFRIF
ncbi:multidrug resistance-associated protein 5, partial [Tanacetum coccineum]